MSDERQRLGAEGERLAEAFLKRQGYRVLTKNYRCPGGEIDLVCLEGTTIVFVEVKTRTQTSFGSPFEAVDHRKQGQIRRAARFYLAQHRLHDRSARFDVVGVWWDAGSPRCELLRNAFAAR